jgi:hypothetical protein
MKDFRIEYKGDFTESWLAEKIKLSEWKFNPSPDITVVSADGSIDTERDNVKIILSNGDEIEFSCYYVSGGPGKGYNGKPIENFASILIRENGSSATREYNVVEEFQENLEQYGSVVLSILELYKKLSIF